ncbi:alpha-beta hydrolase superfamily lysophospholipase [Streptacidiphilus sp. BW17]|uniref:alpha/beta hydrolase n=1 Tax=unclassified Streptacidiphilus TaxID=2643834 RepID=UPI00351466D4
MDKIQLASVDGLALDAAVHRVPMGRRPVGTVIQAHGINTDKDEGGMFIRLAEALAESGFTVIRFSFRGHGASDGAQRGITIAGEMLDLEAAVDFAVREHPGPLFMVAASFGAVATSLSLPWLGEHLSGVVLWNPVLDLRRTFLEPELPWGIENFSESAQDRLHDEGSLMLDGEFELGRVLFAEMRCHQPGESFTADSTPAIIIHGDRDSYVSYDIAREAAQKHPRCGFHSIHGSDHGFDSREREDEAITVSVGWLADRAGSST